MNENVRCPDCGSLMVLRETSKYKTRDNRNKKFYGCSAFPVCRAIHGAHPDGRPLGVPGDVETKRLRIRVHAEAERVWGKWSEIAPATKRRMYAWLAANSTSGHIAKMLKGELLDTLAKLEQLTAEEVSHDRD